MLTYKYEEELKFAQFYADKFNDKIALSILEAGCVKNSEEARHLSLFFWKMVDAAIEDDKNKTESTWTTSGQFLTEKLLQSIYGYLNNAGYENEWEEASDQQDS